MRSFLGRKKLHKIIRSTSICFDLQFNHFFWFFFFFIIVMNLHKCFKQKEKKKNFFSRFILDFMRLRQNVNLIRFSFNLNLIKTISLLVTLISMNTINPQGHCDDAMAY